MPTRDKINFAKAFKELEEITESFERDNIDLDAGLSKFERGLELAHALKEKLESVENRVEVIKKKFRMEDVTTDEEDDEPDAPKT